MMINGRLFISINPHYAPLPINCPRPDVMNFLNPTLRIVWLTQNLTDFNMTEFMIVESSLLKADFYPHFR